MLPPQRRIRVLLGQPPVTMADLIARPRNRAQVTTLENRVDRHYASVVEREVLAKGRRALMIAGDGHMLKGLRAPEDQNRPNVATALEQRHPGSVYSVDLLLIPPNPTDTALQHFLQTARTWPPPSILPLAGTPLGAMTTPLDATNWINSLGNRAISPATRRYDRQADAILWLGPGAAITASQTDPAIYHWGTYPDDLRRLDPIIHAIPEKTPTDSASPTPHPTGSHNSKTPATNAASQRRGVSRRPPPASHARSFRHAAVH